MALRELGLVEGWLERTTVSLALARMLEAEALDPAEGTRFKGSEVGGLAEAAKRSSEREALELQMT